MTNAEVPHCAPTTRGAFHSSEATTATMTKRRRQQGRAQTIQPQAGGTVTARPPSVCKAAPQADRDLLVSLDETTELPDLSA
jgi:hypothetical protein